MLRTLLQDGEESHNPELSRALEAIRSFRKTLNNNNNLEPKKRDSHGNRKKKPSGNPMRDNEVQIRLDLWATGFVDALEELEESIYAAQRFAEPVHSSFVDEMDEEEALAYRLHLYFYKNAFVRIFSVLDKLGYFMNERFGLRTEKVKQRFSYYTVLRQMKAKHVEPGLEHVLYELKIAYAEPLQRLRSLRNMEIHHQNMEMLDDMMRAKRRNLQDGRQKVEHLENNMQDLYRGFEMVCRALAAAFIHAKTIE